jgi:hypothetical protein
MKKVHPTPPDITIEYDALGRQKTVSTSVAKTDFTYNPTLLLLDTEPDAAQHLTT